MNRRPPEVNGSAISVTSAGDDGLQCPQAQTAMRALAATGVFPATADQVRRARRFTAGLLDGWPIADDVVMCVSELATNAVLHSSSRQQGGTFAVRLETAASGHIRVAVRDNGGPWTRREHGDGRPHGLDIVRQLASEFGVEGDGRHGRTVWVRLKLAEPVADVTPALMIGRAGNGHADASQATGTLIALADELTARDLDTWSPRWDGSEYLLLTSVAQALSEVTVKNNGLIVWEHRPLHRNPPDPNRMTAMVLTVLLADQAVASGPATAQGRDQPLTDNVRQLLTEHGIRVTRKTYGAGSSDAYTEIEAVNPARTARGRALIADDGMLRWECRLNGEARIQGIDLPEIASTIAHALRTDSSPDVSGADNL
jgi:anti-sigma regulatory factor (Ser/Thr protein kinase)